MQRTEVGEAYEASTSALQAAKGQRLSLRRAIEDLERALGAPGDDGAWRGRLDATLDHLRAVWAVHIDVTEGEGGLYEEIVENAPRLANRVARFRREHVELAAAVQGGLDATRDGDGEVGQLRDRLVRLLADLTRHRKRGLDLVYEAYHVDIGGES
jgi:hypothetical protein